MATLAFGAMAFATISPPARAWTLVCEAAIPAEMIDKVDSATAYPGMRFRFKITTTARIDGVLVPAGAIGYGYVRYVSAASNRDRNGALILEMREVVSGPKHLAVMADPRESARWAPATSLAEQAIGYVPIAGLIRTAANEVRNGRNVTIGPGFTFHVVGIGNIPKMQPCHKIGT
ncbi:MAG TPA: hypothetical protein VGN11_02930 [Candidatus Baltobacteraceae bacterium]|nr:hypothetical protein [Candidatus Baltobacteraceae bacterium]